MGNFYTTVSSSTMDLGMDHVANVSTNENLFINSSQHSSKDLYALGDSWNETSLDAPYEDYDDEGRLILLSTNGTSNFWSFPGDLSTKYLLNAGTASVLFSGFYALAGIALFTLYHAAYFGENAVRRKRAISDDGGSLFGVQPSNFDKSFESSPTNFSALFALDANWCALRLACELSARAAGALTEDERHLMMYFRSVITEPDLRTMPLPSLYYGFASYLGFRSNGDGECANFYPRCPFGANEMLKIYTKEKSAPDQEKSHNFKARAKSVLSRFRDRNLDLNDGKSTILKTLTDYEIQRREARKSRVEHLLKRRQRVMQRLGIGSDDRETEENEYEN
ncbi:uncharacterized protein LOC108668541 [Hyalella azteca]|uniref:Uncharacterized protein LOC108668541 n=1 Tax=Hyalella azteca TaxID=294128 RepID=A0A8B7NCJ5_HYAAZ|nr:uncharacterized protein LOC108668541 [Hyalella azteca]